MKATNQCVSGYCSKYVFTAGLWCRRDSEGNDCAYINGNPVYGEMAVCCGGCENKCTMTPHEAMVWDGVCDQKSNNDD